MNEILHHQRNTGMIRFPCKYPQTLWFPLLSKWCKSRGFRKASTVSTMVSKCEDQQPGTCTSGMWRLLIATQTSWGQRRFILKNGRRCPCTWNKHLLQLLSTGSNIGAQIAGTRWSCSGFGIGHRLEGFHLFGHQILSIRATE